MQLYPKDALEKLEFEKILTLLQAYCQLDAAKKLSLKLKASSNFKQVRFWLHQSQEYKLILESNDYLPNSFQDNLEKELQFLQIENSVLQEDNFLKIKKLCLDIQDKIRWFKGKEDLYPHLYFLLKDTVYEKEIVQAINPIIDDTGQIQDRASRNLSQIRSELQHSRIESRKQFDQTIRKYAKAGYLADITENFLNGRRTIGIQAEFKRIVKGIIHGVSDSNKIVFIEPESLIPIQNRIYELEIQEKKEIQAILRDLTAKIAPYLHSLEHYYHRSIVFDFIRAKALLARKLKANLPNLVPHPNFTYIVAP